LVYDVFTTDRVNHHGLVPLDQIKVKTLDWVGLVLKLDKLEVTVFDLETSHLS